MKNNSILLKSVFAILLLSISKFSLAITCSYGSYGQLRPNTPYYNFGSVIVQRDTPVGTILKTLSVNHGSYSGMLGCDSPWTEIEQMTLFTSSSSISGVYDTNIAGIGIRVGYAPNYNFNHFLSHDGGVYLLTSENINAYLVKTVPGAVGAGNLRTGILTKQIIAESSSYYVDTGLGSTTIIPVACSISTPNLNFPIGDVLASNFGSSIGTTPAGAQNTQNLGLNCDSGANINVALNGTQNPDVGTTSVLALTNQGSADVAKGVGVQILYNGSPLVLNNRIWLKTSSGGQETFPITARYYQTKTAVTTGKANASATLDLTYQ
jgi:P pilus assembly protein, pilin FimA